MTRSLSKSKLQALRQCPRRLWLEVHRPDLRADSAAARSRFDAGYEVGDLARRLFDPRAQGVLLDAQREGYDTVLRRTTALLADARPIFEGGFSAAGGIAFADVMLPVDGPRGRSWRIVEVKSAASVKDYHRDDVAIQHYVASQAGVSIESIWLAHVDTTWTYPGDGNYAGLLAAVESCFAFCGGSAVDRRRPGRRRAPGGARSRARRALFGPVRMRLRRSLQPGAWPQRRTPSNGYRGDPGRSTSTSPTTGSSTCNTSPTSA